MPEDFRRLAEAITHARVGAGHRTRRDFAGETRISLRVLSDLETARRTNYDAATLAAVEVALGWLPGSCRAVLAGGSPGTAASAPGSPGRVRVTVEFEAVPDGPLRVVSQRWVPLDPRY